MARGRGQRAAGEGGRRAGIADADRIVNAAMTLIAERGWRVVSLAAVASEAGLPTLQVYRLFPSRTAILCGFFRQIDEAVLSALAEPEAGERPRDRVFDLLMRRFDALQPYRLALERLRRELPFDPLAMLAAGAALLGSMRLMLEAAGVPCNGVAGTIAVKLTAAAYIAASQTWVRDDTPDLAPTMATLDRRLRGIERWFVQGRTSASDAPPAEA